MKEQEQNKKFIIIKEVSKIVASILAVLKENIKIGMSGKDLEKIASKLMEKNGVKSSSLGYGDFPATICVSLNEELTHGVPDERVFKNGDVVSIDVACYKEDEKGNSYHADAALTEIVGEGNKEQRRLIEITKECLKYAVTQIEPGITTTKDIGTNIERYALDRGYYSIREYGGHGIGEELHQFPFIPNYRSKQSEVIKEGMFVCIEPLIQERDRKIKISSNNKWTVISENKNLNAHFEHTIYIDKKEAIILTTLDE